MYLFIISLLKQLEKWAISNKLLLFVSLTFFSLLISGVNNFAHNTYNINPLLESKMAYETVTLNNYSSLPWSIQYYYIQFLSPIIEYGLIFLALSLFIKLLFFVIIYKLVYNILKDENQSLLVVVLLILAKSLMTHGLVYNGIWEGPIIMPASISAFFSLLGLYYLFNYKYIKASIPLFLSIHFHPLYGLSFLGWIFIGFILIEWKINSFKYIKQSFVSIVIIISNIVYLAIISQYDTTTLSENYISVSSWYNMIYALNPDDTFILETILWYGPTLIPPIILAAYLSIKSPIKKAPEYLMIGTFISLLLFVSIELFHTSGYFLGKISESFITLQMRRGFWVATMFSLIIIIPNFKSLFNNISIKTFNFLAFVTAIIFLGMNQIVTPIVYFYMFYLAFTNTKDKVFIFLAIITILLVILSKQYGEWPLHHSNKYFIYFFGSCILYYFFLRMYKDFILSKVITLSVFTFISFGLAKGLYEGKLYKSSQILFNNTIFGKTNHKLMIKQHHKNNHLDLQMSDYFKNLPLLEKDGYYMTVPPSEITYADKAFYGISIYFSWVNLVSPIINRAQYNISYDKLVILYGKNVVDKYYDTFTNTKENFINYFDNEYNKISVNNLKKLYTNKKIRYYCSPFSRLDLYGTLIYKGSKHYLYDLSLIAGFKIK